MRLLRDMDVIEIVDRHTRKDGTLDEDISVILEEVETAFDKEKVVERLEELSRNHFESADAIGNEEEYGEAFAYKHAVEVVRKGGITNDIKL